ncbi:hypothetical protein [Rhodanobacter soli]
MRVSSHRLTRRAKKIIVLAENLPVRFSPALTLAMGQHPHLTRPAASIFPLFSPVPGPALWRAQNRAYLACATLVGSPSHLFLTLFGKFSRNGQDQITSVRHIWVFLRQRAKTVIAHAAPGNRRRTLHFSVRSNSLGDQFIDLQAIPSLA